MKKIGLLSDTHAYIDDFILNNLKECDEIWHAGDFGSIDVAKKLATLATVKAVYGNVDGTDVRNYFPLDLRFKCEQVDVLMTHIGGYPNRYEKRMQTIFNRNPPKLFIAGHSHILKVMYDKRYNFLHINPGAAGKYGFHLKRTLIRFQIDGDLIQNLEVVEIDK